MKFVKFVREEGGFTLVEALVAMLMMLTVMFALYAVFDAGVRVFRFGNDKIEAVENARLGLERVERELRAASPYDPASDPPRNHLFFAYGNPSQPSTPSKAPTSNANSVTFGNDFDGVCGLRKAVSAEECAEEGNARELISYYVNSDDLLIRRNNNQYASVIENVDSLEFQYLDAEGGEVSEEFEIARVDITLVVRVEGRSQTLSTSVALRNRSG